jgi:hexosaminidase
LRAFLIVLLCAVPTFASAEPQTNLNLMPMPASVQVRAGQLVLAPSFSVGISGYSDPRLKRSVELFLVHMGRQTGLPPQALKIIEGTPATLLVHAARANQPIQELGEDESYTLDVSTAGATLNAETPLGVTRGLETFLQLVQTTADGFAVRSILIEDKPRFPWRGLMIDVGRHFIPLEVLKRNLDGMAAVKLNVFHWHLSEDQGFRVESKKFPRLHQMGSDGLYYTQDEVRDLIAYARERGIRVVPEFDMPGHSTAWFVGYPELASGPGPYQIERKWGIFDPAMDPTSEQTYKFLDKFIGEMAHLFPDKYFHIGGDELKGKDWDTNPRIQAFKQAHGLKNNQDLQAYFNRRVEKIVSKHGKIMIGWDEILRPELPKEIVVQSWRGQASLADASRQGFRGILSFGYYLDLIWPASRHYAVDPLSDAAATLSPEEQQRILGGEACMWSEYVSPENIDSRIWPRLAAIAERLWSRQDVKDADSMYERMQATSRWLDGLGLTHNSSYEPMLRRIVGTEDVSALQTLADVVEPVKDYTREESPPLGATSFTPLNRLVDAARPESATARHFAEMVDTLLAGKADAGSKAQIKTQLVRWRGNDGRLETLAAQSSLLKEAVPLSQNLAAVASTGLEALEYIDRGERAPDEWKMKQMALLQQAQQQKAQMLLMIVPSVQKLVEEAGNRGGKE